MGKDPEEVCAAKNHFDTPAQASVELARIRRVSDRNGDKHIPHSWYQCPICEKYCLTSKERPLKDLKDEFF